MEIKEKFKETINPGVINPFFEDFERLFSEESFQKIKSNFRRKYYDEIHRKFDDEYTSVTFQEQIDERNIWTERVVKLSDFYTPVTNNIFTLLKEQISKLLYSPAKDEYLKSLKLCRSKLKKLTQQTKLLTDRQYKELLNGYLSQFKDYFDNFDHDFQILNPIKNDQQENCFCSNWFSNQNIDLVITLREELIENRMINKVSKPTFYKIFNNQNSNKPPRIKINWLKTEISFRDLINELIKAQILDIPFSKQMRIANKCVSLKGDQTHDWTLGGRSGKYENADSKVIKRIIKLAKSKVKE
jgi:hypothetical protein